MSLTNALRGVGSTPTNAKKENYLPMVERSPTCMPASSVVVVLPPLTTRARCAWINVASAAPNQL